MPHIAGIDWLIERAGSARSLELHFDANSNAQTIVRALMKVPGSFRMLTSLSVSAGSYSHESYAPEDMPSICVAVGWLLGQSSGLEFLNIEVDGLPCLPGLAHIKHLRLQTSDKTLANLVSLVASLRTLQTLSLTERCSSPQDVVLDLRALGQLKSLQLDGLVPIAIALAPSAELHVTVYSLETASSNIWSNLAHDRVLKSFTLEAEYLDMEYEMEIPEWMLETVRLDTLVLSLNCFGFCYGDQIQLKGAFACAERLCIVCRSGLYIKLPLDQAWRWVNFHSNGELHVSFQSIADFAIRVPLFSFKYVSLHGADLISLVSFMLIRRLKCDAEQLGAMPSAIYSPCCSLAELDLRDVCHSKCRCGACPACCRPGNYQGLLYVPGK